MTIEAGQIVEDGNHRTLLQARGRYAALWAMQTADLETLTRAAQ